MDTIVEIIALQMLSWIKKCDQFFILYNSLSLPIFWWLTWPVFTYTGRWMENSSYSVHFSSVAQPCPTLWDPMNRSTPGLPVHHQLLEFTQTHIHRIGDAIQPSHPLLSLCPPAPNLSQYQGLFQWLSSLHVCWSFSFSISLSNKYSGLISLRID